MLNIFPHCFKWPFLFSAIELQAIDLDDLLTVIQNSINNLIRRVLKARYLGLDEGDVSTLED